MGSVPAKIEVDAINAVVAISDLIVSYRLMSSSQQDTSLDTNWKLVSHIQQIMKNVG